MTGTAVISPDGTYRYRLTRELPLQLGVADRTCVFVMLNPSTDDAQQDDPTLRRCMYFAEQAGCSRLIVVNLFAYRATAPVELFTAQRAGVDVVGPDNAGHIRAAVAEADEVVAAWGASAPTDQVARVQSLIGLRALSCLGMNDNGSPKHPLYVLGSTSLRAWSGVAA